MGENIEVKDVQKTEYLDKNGLDMLWAKVKENTHNQVEVERNRAVAKENSIVDTKADKSALDNYVTDAALKALEQKVTANTTAISAKQDKPDDGNMFLQVKHDSVSGYFKRKGELKFTNDDNDSFYTSISPSGIYCWNENSSINFLRITSSGITLDGGGGTSGYAFTTNGKTAHIPTKLSQLANDSNFITADDIDFTPYATIEALTAVEQKVTANTTALEGKQAAGNYLPYKTFDNRNNKYEMQDDTTISISGDLFKKNTQAYINGYSFQTFCPEVGRGALVEYNKIEIGDDNGPRVRLSDEGGGQILVNSQYDGTSLTISKDGIKLLNGDDNHVLTSNASTIDITQYAKKTELPTVPTKTSQLTNDSNFMQADTYDENGYHLLENLNIGLENNGVTTINALGIESTGGDGFSLNGAGISFYARGISDIPTAQGGFINIDDYALNSQVTALEQTVTANTTALKGKQDKGNYVVYSSKDENGYTIDNTITMIGNNTTNKTKIVAGGITFAYKDNVVKYSSEGIKSNKFKNCLVTSYGSFKPISDFVLKEEEGLEYVSYDEFASVKVELDKKQNRITANRVDATNLETADITQLRAIVKNLLTALGNSGLIISSSDL